MSIGDAEIKTQERVIRFFKDPEILGYQYIGNLSDYQNKNIKEDRLRQYLRLKGYADKLIDAAIMQLQQEAGNLSRGVYDANKTVYSRLKYGIPVSESPEKPPVTVQLVDEEKPLNNDFAIAEEVTVVEQSEKRPDLVVYLNGIAVASPLICYALDYLAMHRYGYKFGYELLMLNGILTFAWMYALSSNEIINKEYGNIKR